uniref:CSON002396 protein n=1 Tax=Culicoides sonorensis TaxID=179676 RepID=A0A336LHX8_CULSO
MSIKEEEMDDTMSKIFENLNLNSISTEMQNLSLNKLNESLASLGKFVIVGKFDNQETQQKDFDSKVVATNLSESKEISKGGSEKVKQKTKHHDEKIFNLSCQCSECTKHRETIIQLYLEDYEYNQLWERLQTHLLTFYDIIPQSDDSPIFMKYKELMKKSQSKWLSDGLIDLKNNFRLSLGSYLPLTDELIFTILCKRDPHQLFELICIQMQAVVLAYTEGLKNILKYNAQMEIVDYNPSELLNYIFDGYTKICHCEKMLSTIFYDLEAGHLLQFNLSLSQVYKRMYHRWIYLELQKLVPECILKLKELEYDDNYKVLVQKFINFDDAMTSVTQTWRDIWLLIHHYHQSKEDLTRRRSIRTIHSIFQMIKDSDFDFDKDFVLEEKPLVDWITCEKRNEVWQYVVHNIKNDWISCSHPRLMASLINMKCNKCGSPFVPHFIACNCRSCLIAGGPLVAKMKDNVKSPICTKCEFFDKYVNGVISKKSAITNEENVSERKQLDEKPKQERKVYHLCWAVFKHMPNRSKYNAAKIDPSNFCVFQDIPCNRYACRIAANIITLTYPLNFSKFLVKNYRELNEATRKKIMSLQTDVNTIKKLYETKCKDSGLLSEKLHPLQLTDMKWANGGDLTQGVDDEPIKRASALAEGFLVDFPMPQKNIIFSYFFKLFRVVDQDIEFNYDHLDHLKQSNVSNMKLKVDTTAVKSRGGIDQLDDINIRMNNLKIMNKVSRGSECSDKCSERCLENQSKPGFIDGEIQKPLVEALQLAASNKKLEAELRTLQKEHSMLKDMVRDLEHIHEEKHQGNHSEDESSDSRESKSSHRTEGQCICYYCTIFGQNDCSHNSRVNETRDRLRKRLRKMQANNKDSKPISFKEIVNASFSKKLKTRETNDGKKVVYQQTNAKISSKEKLQPQNHPVQKLAEIIPTEPLEEGIKIQKVTPINCAPVDDILKFIEGDAVKKEKEALAAKKAAKKKQKQRKMEQKKIADLEDLKSQYVELSVQENEIKKSLKLLRKRKNKNRLNEAEEKLLDISTKKQEIVSHGVEIVLSINKTNSNFVYYFDEEQKIPPLPQLQKQQHEITKIEQPHPVEERNCEISLDASKRMVTIRRINVPHSEPQVTVTAKGASPDKDTLLYTFINGQLVPASPVNQQLLHNINYQASQYTQNYIKPTPLLSNNNIQPTQSQKLRESTNCVPIEKSKNLKKTPNLIEIQKMQQQIQKQQRNTIKKEEKVKNSNKNEKNNIPNKKDKNSTKDTPETISLNKKHQAAEIVPKKSNRELKRERRQKNKENQKDKSNKNLMQDLEIPNSNVIKKEKQKRPTSYIDPEFDNNAFKLLNIDDSESDCDSGACSEDSMEMDNRISKSYNVKEKEDNDQKCTRKPETVSLYGSKNTNNKNDERKQSLDSVSSQTKSRKNSQQEPNSVSQISNQKGKQKVQQLQKKGTKASNHEPINDTNKSVKSIAKTKKSCKSENNQEKTNGVSIMEQLSRGVRVEGLTLPPGITLTRVDPATCENIKAKKESINRISQPISTVVAHQYPINLNPNIMIPSSSYLDSSYLMVNPGSDMPKSENIIMVDTPILKGVKDDSSNNNNKNKRVRKKNKKNTANEINTDCSSALQQQIKKKSAQANGKGDNIVTLKNPMFSNVTQQVKKQQSNIVHPPPPPMSYDQPAAIIKNENGMFTIRNPALHQALAQGQPNTLPHYSNYKNNSNCSTSLNGQSIDDVPYIGDITQNDDRKCKSVIGSEIKTAHQIKQAQKEQQHSHWGGCCDTSSMFGITQNSFGVNSNTGSINKSYSPFEVPKSNCNIAAPGGFNSDFVGARYGNDYSTQNYFSSNVGSHYSPRKSFSPEIHHGSQFENSHGKSSKFDDVNFLQSLQPGQRLNSEVTIHNINEAKFLRDQSADPNGIEITRIQATGSIDSNNDGGRLTLNELLNKSSVYQNRHDIENGNAVTGEYSDNLYGSSSRTSPYGNPYFDPGVKTSTQIAAMGLNRAPGSKQHSCTQKTSESPSSLFGELSSSLSMSNSNTPPSDDPLVDFALNSDPIFYDASKNGPSVGVIGGEIKAVHNCID